MWSVWLSAILACLFGGVYAIADDPDQRGHGNLLGWQSGPDTRGTLDIIWSCAVTIFLCSWTVLCINLPSISDGKWYMFRQKMFLTCLSVLGPEFIMMAAIGQLESARRSVADFKAVGYNDWTLKHAFFADMGGFILQPPDWVSFPIDAKQVHYLVTSGYMEYPRLQTMDIDDRNKTDTLVRFITVCQATWFLLSWAARFAQHLEVTTLEMTTVGFIACALVTCYCWWHKPADIMLPTVLKIDTPIRDILLDGGVAASRPYRLTPLDFVADRNWSWNVYWDYWVKWFSPIANLQSKSRPLKRLPNDRFPSPSTKALNFLMFINALFGAVNIAAWNFTFPTPVERLLWRVSTLAIPASLFIFWAADTVLWSVWPTLKWRRRRPLSNTAQIRDVYDYDPERRHDKAESITQVAGSGSKDFGLGENPSKNISPPAIAIMSFIATLYTLARGYIIIEDLISLRLAPVGIYKTVQWTTFLPAVN